MNYESVGWAFQTYADSRTESKMDNNVGEIPRGFVVPFIVTDQLFMNDAKRNSL